MSTDGQETMQASATSEAHDQQSIASNVASGSVHQVVDTGKQKTESLDAGLPATEEAAGEGGNVAADTAMEDSPALSRNRKRKSAVDVPADSTDSPMTRRTRTAAANEAAANETPPSKKSKTPAKSPMVCRLCIDWFLRFISDRLPYR
jgi:hypothetical protein